MSSGTILFETQDRVATLTLNRPERHDAFNVTVAQELREARERVEKDGEIVVAIAAFGE